MKISIREQSGFTLLELLLSIAILSIVLTAFFSFFSQGMLFSSRNEERLLATDLAREISVVLETNYQPEQPDDRQTIIPCSHPVFQTIPQFDASTCQIERNQRNFYVRAIAEKDPNFSLYELHVQIFRDANFDTLLTETFAYTNQLQDVRSQLTAHELLQSGRAICNGGMCKDQWDVEHAVHLRASFTKSTEKLLFVPISYPAYRIETVVSFQKEKSNRSTFHRAGVFLDSAVSTDSNGSYMADTGLLLELNPSLRHRCSTRFPKGAIVVRERKNGNESPTCSPPVSIQTDMTRADERWLIKIEVTPTLFSDQEQDVSFQLLNMRTGEKYQGRYAMKRTAGQRYVGVMLAGEEGTGSFDYFRISELNHEGR
ncbi:type IV pilus modification PilV family protein [Halalkalibacterium ligniniphilum]|uniref:type IV pilus modification PilV family protein n=1 Tax=Halalkalibacterium ligniniphilum TaxID=1134413 RepID=UPI00034AE112|nr:type II secretion system protein [Halalkalibacterium ligniniphilum]